jgi:hypothetical protein
MKHVAQILNEAGGLDGLLDRGRKGMLNPDRRFSRTSEDLRALRKALERKTRNESRTRVEVVRVHD